MKKHEIALIDLTSAGIPRRVVSRLERALRGSVSRIVRYDEVLDAEQCVKDVVGYDIVPVVDDMEACQDELSKVVMEIHQNQKQVTCVTLADYYGQKYPCLVHLR